MSQPEAVSRAPFEYVEQDPNNYAHPLSGMHIERPDVGAIDQVMGDIEQRRRELPGENSQFFAGIIQGDGLRGNTLLVIDHGGSDGYVVRTAPLDGSGEGQYFEDVITRDRRTHNRGPGQTLKTHALGDVNVDITGPDPRFENSEVRDTPLVVVFGAHGERQRVMALDDVLREPTTGELVRAANNALDLDRLAKQYPNIDAFTHRVNGRYVQSGRRARVESALRPIREALSANGNTAADRERLVNLGRSIMGIASDNPENNTYEHQVVLDPEKARAMAKAEDIARARPNGFLGRHKKRNETQLILDVSSAENEYDRSLQTPNSRR